MKKLSFFNKIVFIINTIFSIGLLFSIILPNLSPNKFGIVSLLSLVVPILIIGNVFFVLYWVLIGFKKQFLQSFLILILSYFFIPQLYKFNDNSTKVGTNSISIMSFNVRKFNRYKWIKTDSIETKIKDFVERENPDIIALQEYKNLKDFKLKYPYFTNPPAYNYGDSIANSKLRTAFAIYSKYPIINQGVLKYEEFLNCAIFADIVKNKDTLRVYTLHLASLGIIPNANYFGHDDSEKLVEEVNKSFKVQQLQIDSLNNHIKNSKYKVILAGDLNNTSYSWTYKNVKNDLQDSFLETGKGFGSTYKFKKFPLRIDYIFADDNFKINSHQNYDVELSDHTPIKVTLELKK